MRSCSNQEIPKLDIYNKKIEILIDLLKNFTFENTDEITLYNCISCVIGAFFGDALGSYCEFTTANENNHKAIWKDVNPIFKTKKGQVTDDSEMALSMAFGLANASDIDYNTISFFYYFWSQSEPFDIGTTTRNSFIYNLKPGDLQTFDSLSSDIYNKCLLNSKEKNKKSLSNGFLMRNTPMAVYLFLKNQKQYDDFFQSIFNSRFEFNYKFNDKNKSLENMKNIFIKIYEHSKKEIEITHSNQENWMAAAFYDFIIINILSLKNFSKIQNKFDNEDYLNKNLYHYFCERKTEELNKNLPINNLETRLKNSHSPYDQRFFDQNIASKNTQNLGCLKLDDQENLSQRIQNTDIIENVLENIKTLFELKIFTMSDLDSTFQNFKKKIRNILNHVCNSNFQYLIENWQEFINIGKENIGYYLNSFVLIFLILKNLQEFEPECNNVTTYRKIMNFICNVGGDTDTNCAIVGGVIGPLLGIKYFGSGLEDLLRCIPFEREKNYNTNKNSTVQRPFLYSPGLIALWAIFIFKKFKDSK